ncbi:hypothetical protein [Nocardioides sp. AE5]|uniref:hypothetical protein n=1 Tax=Nocardioides sp. AE5 TaxID=2962573 RepID=UPI002880F051|nr:hypothetical protein [Nocardioides sp. AE5]MDT0202237.1 hypothetical protein [Nocardioides sp. AE5]
MTVADLAVETRLVLLAGGFVFVWALALGVVKYAQISRSPQAQAHIYIDIAHRAALMYSFAILLIAVFAELSDWPTVVDLAAAFVQIFFFVAAIASYTWHGLRRDTDNQLRHPSGALTGFMIALIIGEIGGFVVLLAGFVHAWA